MLSVKDPAYKIPSLAFGLIVKALVPSGAVLTKVTTRPIEIAGKVNTTPAVAEVIVFPESPFTIVSFAALFSRLSPVNAASL